MEILLLIIILSPIYIIVGLYYAYKVLSKREKGHITMVDLDSVKSDIPVSFRIDPVQVFQTRDELNISILGLNLKSEIRIEKASGDVVYEKETDKCYEKIALGLSKWEKGVYVFSYAEAEQGDKHYVSGIFEV